jgi:hypothetical protein
MSRAALLCALVLAGCASAPPPVPQTITVTKTVYVPWAWPASLQTCALDPDPLAVPHIAAADLHAGSQVATYIARLRAHDAQAVGAADDCRDTLAAAMAANKGAQ